MSAEVDDMRLMHQESLLEVVGTDGPFRDQFERIAIPGRLDLGGNLADLLIEPQWIQGGGLKGLGVKIAVFFAAS